jgi:hypothetical protein
MATSNKCIKFSFNISIYKIHVLLVISGIDTQNRFVISGYIFYFVYFGWKTFKTVIFLAYQKVIELTKLTFYWIALSVLSCSPWRFSNENRFFVHCKYRKPKLHDYQDRDCLSLLLRVFARAKLRQFSSHATIVLFLPATKFCLPVQRWWLDLASMRLWKHFGIQSYTAPTTVLPLYRFRLPQNCSVRGHR